MSQFQFYVGVDWGASSSQVCVLGQDGEVIRERKVSTSEELVGFIRQWCVAAPIAVAIAIERRDLLITDVLVELGYSVFTLNPKQADRFRDRFGPSGAKDDRRDGRVLASAVRTDVNAFRQVKAPSEEEVILRSLHRTRGQAVLRRRAAANQLRAEVFRVLPGLVALCPGADRTWFRDVVRLLAKSPKATSVAVEDFDAVLGRVKKLNGDAIVRAVRENHAPSDALWAAFRVAARTLVEELELASEHIRNLERELALVLNSMRRESESVPPTLVDILSSMPGVGPIATTALVAVTSEALNNRDLQRLRAVSGVAPVTKQSGRSHIVMRRRACHHDVQQAMFHAAAKAAAVDTRFKALYAAARARGHSRPRALRTVADAMLRVLVAMLRDKSLYAANPAAR